MKMEQSVSPDHLSDNNVISNNYYTELMRDDHRQMMLYPSLNPLDEEDFRNDGVIKMQTLGSNQLKSVQSDILSPFEGSLIFKSRAHPMVPVSCLADQINSEIGHPQFKRR